MPALGKSTSARRSSRPKLELPESDGPTAPGRLAMNRPGRSPLSGQWGLVAGQLAPEVERSRR